MCTDTLFKVLLLFISVECSRSEIRIRTPFIPTFLYVTHNTRARDKCSIILRTHWYSWKQSFVWQRARALLSLSLFMIPIMLFYKSGTSRFRRGTNATIIPATGGSALSTGAAFIRDNFVDYPDTQLTKREIKARRMQVCRFRVDPSGNLPRRATYLWKFNVLHVQRVRGPLRPLWPLRLSLERATRNSSVGQQLATRSSTISSTIARERRLPRKLKLGQFNCPVRTVGFINRRHGEKESRPRSEANERYSEAARANKPPSSKYDERAPLSLLSLSLSGVILILKLLPFLRHDGVHATRRVLINVRRGWMKNSSPQHATHPRGTLLEYLFARTCNRSFHAQFVGLNELISHVGILARSIINDSSSLCSLVFFKLIIEWIRLTVLSSKYIFLFTGIFIPSSAFWNVERSGLFLDFCIVIHIIV